jgi:hypothetical protein
LLSTSARSIFIYFFEAEVSLQSFFYVDLATPSDCIESIVKVQLSLCTLWTNVGGSGGIAPLTVNFGTTGE